MSLTIDSYGGVQHHGAMAVPDFQTLMLPVMEILADGVEHTSGDVRQNLASRLSLTDTDLAELLPSGTQPVFHNRSHWALWYLQKAGLIERLRRGVHRITDRGREVLKTKPKRIDLQLLDKFPEIRALRQRSTDQGDAVEEAPADPNADTPEAMLAKAYEQHRRAVEADILGRLHQVSPSRFEAIVIEVLVGMGYGGSIADAAQRIGRSGDGGLDGVIKEDPLGLDVVYVQAKRWEGSVGRPEIQKFAGSLQGARARKGIFIATSRFSREAIDYVDRIETRIVLIDGGTLARLMFDHGVGLTVAKEQTYAVKQIDDTFYDDE